MKSLKVNRIEKNTLSKKEMLSLTGGQRPGMCGCGCKYEEQEGSSSTNNGLANADLGIWSGDKYVCIQTVTIDGKN